MNAPDTSLLRLSAATMPLEQLVLSCVLTEGQRIGAQPLLRGVDVADYAYLAGLCGTGFDLAPMQSLAAEPFDEFDELFELLWEYAEPQDAMGRWLACAISTAAQRNNHLWQDMGLPSRRELSAILNLRFPRLAAQNVNDMKWKKFFYRQLCQRSGISICKSPSCADCCDYAICFGPEH
ncbi:nitrogen fixation protein NifQ [Uliginosibacterium gangwonense]|uniref:nitrogen fixation protein NifQ n=1 Tax=Uliginosibacterium gangwonense TaxID=392736 RepID=UPI0003648226|nr:nitrogen fixation protein NifQ [Uliginosibacterium gangwonense]